MRLEATKSLFSQTENGVSLQVSCRYHLKTGYIGINTRFQKSYGNTGASKTNRESALFLGVTVAEKVLSKVFKNVERMPLKNKGYDFKCSHNYKIEVKSSTKIKNAWQFNINQNLIADYFLLIGFDNRIDLNPLHVWLIPQKNIGYLKMFRMGNLKPYKEFELIDKLDSVIQCCNNLRGT